MNPLVFVDPYGLESFFGGGSWFGGGDLGGASGPRGPDSGGGAISRGISYVQNALASVGSAIWSGASYAGGAAWDTAAFTGGLAWDTAGIAWNGVAWTAPRVWNAPNTALGLAWGGLGYVAGALPSVQMPTVSFDNNAIQFENHPLMFGAVTLGNAISYSSTLGPSDYSSVYGRRTQTGLHEMGHTYQYQLLGPFFLPIYFMSGGVSAANPWEQAADNYATGGSWLP